MAITKPVYKWDTAHKKVSIGEYNPITYKKAQESGKIATAQQYQSQQEQQGINTFLNTVSQSGKWKDFSREATLLTPKDASGARQVYGSSWDKYTAALKANPEFATKYGYTSAPANIQKAYDPTAEEIAGVKIPTGSGLLGDVIDMSKREPQVSDVKIAGSKDTTLQDFTGQTPQQIADKGFQISGTNVYSNGKIIGTTTAKPIDTTIDLTGDIKDTSALDKNEKMIKYEKQVLDIYKERPDAIANEAFIQAVAQAKFGRPATAEELAHVSKGGTVGGSLRDVLIKFGLVDKAEDLGVGEPFEIPKGMEKIAHPDLAKNYENIVEDPTGTFLYGKPKKDITPAGEGTSAFDDTTEQAQPVEGKSALDKKQDLVDSHLKDKKGVREEAKEDEEVSEIQTLRNNAQETANNMLTKIEQTKTEMEGEDILNEEAKIALKNKIEGQTIPMAFINRQLLSGMEDLNQAQRLERLYDTYEVNQQINLYNAQLRQVSLYEGRYQDAMDNVKESVEDWEEMQKMQLDILEEEGEIEKEERKRYESEIAYERGLMEQGMVHIADIKTRDDLVKKLGVTADTYGQYFYDDPGSPKIYLRPQVAGDEVKSLMLKYPDAGISITDSWEVASSKLSNSRIYQKATKATGSESTTKTFKFTSDDLGRLLAVGFTSQEANDIQSDINESGVNQVIEGMTPEQSKAVKDIAGGLTPLQADPDEDKITQGERNVISGIRILMGDDVTIEELKEYVDLNGYDIEDFSDEWANYTPPTKKRWFNYIGIK